MARTSPLTAHMAVQKVPATAVPLVTAASEGQQAAAREAIISVSYGSSKTCVRPPVGRGFSRACAAGL